MAVKLIDFTDFQGNVRKVVDINDVESCPVNVKMYPIIEEHINSLKGSMWSHFQETGIPNIEPIEVDEDGIVLSGNTRLYCAKELNKGQDKRSFWGGDEFEIKYLYAFESQKRFKDMSPMEAAKYAQSRNIDGKRDENDVRVACQVYSGLREIYQSENPTGNFNKTKDHKEFCQTRGLDRNDFNKLMYIYDKNMPELLVQIQNKEIGISKAYSLAKGNVKQEYKPDPDRFPFIKHFDENPSLGRDIVSGIRNSVNYFNNMPINGMKLVHDDDYGFEKNQTTSVYSNIINCTIASVYSDHGVKAVTGRGNQTAGWTKSRPDVFFPDITKMIAQNFKKKKLKLKRHLGDRLHPNVFFMEVLVLRLVLLMNTLLEYGKRIVRDYFSCFQLSIQKIGL